MGRDAPPFAGGLCYEFFLLNVLVLRFSQSHLNFTFLRHPTHLHFSDLTRRAYFALTSILYIRGVGEKGKKPECSTFPLVEHSV